MALEIKNQPPPNGGVKAESKEVRLTIRPTTDFKPLSLRGPGGSSHDVQVFEENTTSARWIGKCSVQAAGKPHARVLHKSRYYEEYREWLGLSIYQLCDISTPQVALSAQRVLKRTGSAGELEGLEENFDYVNPCLHIMSEFIPGFQTCGTDFLPNYIAHARDQKAHFQITPPGSTPVPLRGFGATLAVADFIYDGDCVGRSGGNIGYVVKEDAKGEPYAAVVKIDAGCAFSFLDEIDDKTYEHKASDRAVRVAPGKDQGRLFSLHYNQLTETDQREFVATALRILALPWDQIETLVRQTICPDGFTIVQANTLLEKLLQRKKIFLTAFSPEVSTNLRAGIQQEREAVLARWQNERMTLAPVRERSPEREIKQERKDIAAPSSPVVSASSSSVSQILFELENKESATVQLQAQLGDMAAEGKMAERKRAAPACRSFQIPAMTQNFTGRQDLLAKLASHMHAQQEGSNEMIILSVCGLGGVGKTQLAARYMELALQNGNCGNHYLNYQGIIWLYAERDLSSQFSELAAAWFNIKGLSPQETLTALHQQLYRQRILIVLDNAKDNTVLMPIVKIFQGGPYHILVTTRNPDWDKIPVFMLSGFGKEEGAAYVKKHLPDASEENLFALLEAVSYLPLALSHAVAYIREGYCTLAEYPRQFALHQLSLGGSATASDSGQTVMTTFLLSLARLSAHYPAAEAILKACAHLSPENIPLVLLQLYLVGTEAGQYSQQIFEASVAALVGQSLLQPTGADKGLVNMHRLVQRTMMEWNQQTESLQQRQAYLQSWVKYLRVCLAPFDEINEVKLNQQCFLMPHAMYLAQMCTPESGAQDQDLLALLQKIWWHEEVLGHHVLAQLVNERALAITRKHYGPTHPKVVTVLIQLATSYGNDDQHGKNKTLMQEALRLQEQFPNPAPDADDFAQRGLVLDSLDRAAEALTYYNQALALDSTNICTLFNRASVLNDLRRFEEALSSSNQALLIEANSYFALLNRAATLNNLSRFGEALIDVKKSLQLRPYSRKAIALKNKLLADLAVPSPSLGNAASFENKHVMLPTSQAQLAQAVYEFVTAMQAYLATQKKLQLDSQAATSFVAEVVAVFAKGEAQYHSLLTQPENYSIPAIVGNFIDRYVIDHPLLKDLIYHPALAKSLKSTLIKGKIMDIVREFGLSVVEAKAPTAKDAFFDKNTKPNESSEKNNGVEKEVVKSDGYNLL